MPELRRIDREVWVEWELGDEWTAAVRLERQGVDIVAAELRIRPARGVPAGGLTARAFRRLRLGDADTLKPQALALLAASGETIYEPPALAAATQRSLAAEARRRPGPKGRDARFYAGVAAMYVVAARRSRQPVRELAERLRLSPSRVRDLVSAARKRGLLSEPPSRRRAGGELTELGRKYVRILEAEGIPSEEAFGTLTISLGPPPEGADDG